MCQPERETSSIPQVPSLGRRSLLSLAGFLALLTAGRPALALEREDPIPQPDYPNPQAFIERAFEMRQRALDQGDQGYGAVVVREDRIIGQSWSRVILDSDPTGHAEMAAIRDAARRVKSHRLSGATLYSSSRPCPMCEAGAYWAGIEKMVHGRDASDAGRPQLCG